MTNVIKKTVNTIRLFLIVTSCYIQSLCADASTCCPAPCDGYEQSLWEDSSACCPEPCCGRGFASASLLYWRAYEGGHSVCVPGKEINETTKTNVSSHFRGKTKDLHFKWRPGFRVGAGFQSSNDWDVAIFYTNFRSSAERHFCSERKFHWKLDFQVIDLVAGYTFCLSPCFTLRPFIGLRGAEIDRSLRGYQSNSCFTSSFRERNKQDFTGIGPLIGLGATLYLDCGFGLYANLAVSTLYGNYRVNLKCDDKFQGGSNSCYLRHHLHSNTAVVDADFGISWETCFCNQMRLILRLGVEHHCYFNQNRIGSYGDLNLDGGTFSATVVF